MNYFELYPGDYLRDTTRLAMIDHGAYLRLMLAYYGEETPLPGSYDDLYVIVCAVSSADKASVRKVADRFFPVGTDGLRHNQRADKEIEKARKRIANSQKNGSKNRPSGIPSGSPSRYASGSPGGCADGIPSSIPALVKLSTRHTKSKSPSPREELSQASVSTQGEDTR